MTKYLTVILIWTLGLCKGQTYRECNIYQFAGTDSTNKTLSLKQIFNQFGLLESEIYNHHQNSSADGYCDGTYFYYYKDTLLTKRIILYKNCAFKELGIDSAKMICYYNSKNQLIRQEHLEFAKRLKKGVDKGLERPGGCTIDDDDYENVGTWERTSEIKFSYDTNGRKILYDATGLHFEIQNKYTWTYDSLGRIFKYCSFETERLNWMQEFAYTYFKGGYIATRTFYDYDRNDEHLTLSQSTTTYYLDDKGRVINKVTTTEKSKIESTELISYNNNGQVAKTVYLNENGQPEITHIYVYQ